MIIVLTHKRHKSPFKQSKTIYIFTSGWVIVTVQIHSRKKGFKRGENDHCKMDINTGAQKDLQDLMQMGLCKCGGGDV
jgi:hypothetical protein